MIPTKSLVDRIATAIAADPDGLGADPPPRVHLIAAPFDPMFPPTDLSAVAPAYPGYAPIPAAGADVYTKPASETRVVRLVPPEGGWHFEATGAPAEQQTVHGYAVASDDQATIWGAATLDEPVVVSAAGHAVVLGQVELVVAIGGPGEGA